MIEKDYLLRWLRAFFEGLRRLMNKSYINGEEREKEIDSFYLDFFGKNRKYFLKNENTFLVDDLFDCNDDQKIKKEKLSALCQLMEFDLKFEENMEVRSILSHKILFINDILLSRYGYFKLDFQ